MSRNNRTAPSNKDKKNKKSEECCSKEIEKSRLGRKSKTHNTVKPTITKETRKGKSKTLPKRKKTNFEHNCTTLTRKVLSKSLSRDKLQVHSLNSKPVPVDDITVCAISTPPSVERLFTSFRHRRQSVSSTPLLLKKSSKLSGVHISEELLPGKGSLKRKRLIMNSLKRGNEGYEDDLFENCNLEKPFLLDDSGISDVSIATPKCAYMITPNVSTRSPRFKDCYSPSELFKARKVAEEYMHRRNKKRKHSSTGKNLAPAENVTSLKKSKVADIDPEKKRLEFLELVGNLNKKQNLDVMDDSGKDDYFNDISF